MAITTLSAFAISLRTDGFLQQIAVTFYLRAFSGYSCVLSPHQGQLEAPGGHGPGSNPLTMMDGSWCICIPALRPSGGPSLRHSAQSPSGCRPDESQVCTALAFSLSLRHLPSHWCFLRWAPRWTTFTHILFQGLLLRKPNLRQWHYGCLLSKKTEVTNDFCFVAGKLDQPFCRDDLLLPDIEQ